MVLLCYQSCHNHPKRVFCRATRAEYFARILAKQHRNRLHNKMAWALDLNWVQTAGFLNEEVDEDGIVQNVLQVRVRMRL